MGADLASAWDELFTQTGPNAGLVTGSAIQYINSIPTNGPAANLLQTGFRAVYQSVSAKDPVYVSQALVGAGLGSLASGLARETGASGAAEPTGAAGTRSRASGSASSTGAATTTAAATSDQASIGSSNTPQPSTTQSQQTTSSSSTAGVAGQPTAVIMAAGAAAAGVLGFAVLL